jgi:hypothetical protein
MRQKVRYVCPSSPWWDMASRSPTRSETLGSAAGKHEASHAGLAREHEWQALVYVNGSTGGVREWQALLHRLHSGPWLLAGPCPFLSNNLLLLTRSLKFLNS